MKHIYSDLIMTFYVTTYGDIIPQQSENRGYNTVVYKELQALL